MHTVQSPDCITETTARSRESDPHAETKAVVRDFLRCSGYEPNVTIPNPLLRTAIRDCLVSWKSGDSDEALEKYVNSGCALAEAAYKHTSPEHLHYIALYTAVGFYIDDLGGKHLHAIHQFAARFTRGEKQLSPALDAYIDLLRGAHQLWPHIAADEIIATTLDDVAAMCIERTTQEMKIKPHATLFPDYLRTRTGFCRQYVHFIFMKSWRASTESYLQLMPYMERWIAAAKMSFYKEQLAGETNNYMHMRAAAEQTTATTICRKLCDEALQWNRQVLALSNGDRELGELWENFVQGYLEFHFNNSRYGLIELGFFATEKL